MYGPVRSSDAHRLKGWWCPCSSRCSIFIWPASPVNCLANFRSRSSFSTCRG
ncbi:MAG: hypothetical protein MZV64_35725 [Ignavibacteriales bacterium]|nr:hypothetical protein [Ignavibacteriales bacterium]